MTMMVYCKRCHGLGHFEAECTESPSASRHVTPNLRKPAAKKKSKRPKEKRKK